MREIGEELGGMGRRERGRGREGVRFNDRKEGLRKSERVREVVSVGGGGGEVKERKLEGREKTCN